VAELLLQRGANVNCRSKNHLTPMHLAAQEDQVPVAEILVRYKSEIDPQTKVTVETVLKLPPFYGLPVFLISL